MVGCLTSHDRGERLRIMRWRRTREKDPQAACDELHASRPGWVKGSLSRKDTRYLFAQALEARTGSAVEIGTASGFSTAILCVALHLASSTRAIGPDFEVASYDKNQRFYAEPSKEVGDAARELLAANLLDHVQFYSPATASDVYLHHGPDTIGLLFIDGNHRHPWPTLDVLATLDCLHPGARVIIDDINLPSLRPSAPLGPKRLFDGLRLEKEANPEATPPNIGSFRVPYDKAGLRQQLLDIVSANEWETDIPEGISQRLLG